MRYCISTFILISFFSCAKVSPETVQLLVNIQEDFQIQNLKFVDERLVACGGNLWESGGVQILDEHNSSVELKLDAKHSLLDLCVYDDRLFAIGLNNTLYGLRDDVWENIQLDSIFVTRGITTANTKILTAGGVAYFQGHVQIIDPNSLQVILTHKFDRQLNDIEQVNGMTFLAVGYGGIYSSHDEGVIWELNELDGDVFVDTYSTGSKTLILGQSGLIYQTSDGETFEKIRNDGISIGEFRAITETASGRIVIVGDSGKIAYKDAGTDQWEELDFEYDSDLMSITAMNNELYLGSSEGEIFMLTI